MFIFCHCLFPKRRKRKTLKEQKRNCCYPMRKNDWAKDSHLEMKNAKEQDLLMGEIHCDLDYLHFPRSYLNSLRDFPDEEERNWAENVPDAEEQVVPVDAEAHSEDGLLSVGFEPEE